MHWPQIGPPMGVPWQLNRASRLARGLVGWWPHLGSWGRSKIMDRVNGNHTGAVTGTWATDAMFGSVMTATDFYTSVTDAPPLNPTAAITVACWVKPDVSQPDPWIKAVTKGSDAAYTLALKRSSSNTTDFRLWIGGEKSVTGNDLLDAQWHLVVGTYDGATVRLYEDGRQVGSTAATGSISTTSSGLYFGGSTVTGNGVRGKFGDIMLWSRALSSAEVLALYVPQTRWELYQPMIPALYYVPPVVAGQPMALRQSQILTGVRRWGRGF